MAAFAMKWISLTVLVAQNVTLITLMRYSRTVKQEGPRFLTTTAILFSEVLKLFCSCLLVWHETGSISETLQGLRQNVLGSPVEMLKVSLSSLLFTVQGNLLFVSLSYLSGPVHQVISQLKILTTALLSVLILGTELGRRKWFSLTLLTFAVAIIQFPREQPLPAKASELQVPDRTGWAMSGTALGMTAAVLACVSSGMASVYLEKILKQSDVSLWMRNVQLAFLGIPIAFVIALMQDGQKIAEAGVLQGYSPVVYLVVSMSAGGGLVVATVLKYAGNIAKCFATATSVILTCFFSQMMGDFTPDALFVLGTTLVLVATALYSVGPCPTACWPLLPGTGYALVEQPIEPSPKVGSFSFNRLL